MRHNGTSAAAVAVIVQVLVARSLAPRAFSVHLSMTYDMIVPHSQQFQTSVLGDVAPDPHAAK